MQQGQRERIEVGIARPAIAAAGSAISSELLVTGLRGSGEPVIEAVKTSSVMGVELAGEAFEVTPLSPTEQLIVGAARWEFDVRPIHSGRQVLILRISMLVDLPGKSRERVAIPVLERGIHIRINVSYSTRRFLRGNWQWMTATALGLGGTITAWTKLFS
jgi:hypothetical protein